MEPKINLTALSPTYQQLYDLIGKDGMLLLHRELRGQQINFPMRLYDSKKLESIVQQEFNGHNLSALSKKYGYSQRWMHSLVKDSPLIKSNNAKQAKSPHKSA